MARARGKRNKENTVTGQGDAHEPITGEGTTEGVEFPPDDTPSVEAVVGSVARSTSLPPENGSETQRTSTARKDSSLLRPMLRIKAGDARVESLDHYNKGGVGVRIEFPQGAENRPDDEEKAIIAKHVKTQDGDKYPAGYNYDEHIKRAPKFWRKPIVRPGEIEEDVPSNRKRAIRADADARAAHLAADLQDHHDLTHGHADRVEQRRPAQAEAQRIPD